MVNKKLKSALGQGDVDVCEDGVDRVLDFRHVASEHNGYHRAQQGIFNTGSALLVAAKLGKHVTKSLF